MHLVRRSIGRDIRFRGAVLGALLLAVPLSPLWPQATRAPRPDSTNAPPRYPDMLRSARLGGHVRVRLVVDTTGRVDMARFAVLAATNDMFVTALKSVVRRWRFEQARSGGGVVIDSIVQTVEFIPPAGPDTEVHRSLALLEDTVLHRAAVGEREWRLVIGFAPLPALVPVADTALRRAIAVAALDSLVAGLVPRDTLRLSRTVCVAHQVDGATVQPSLDLLRSLSRGGITAVASGRCPPTFASPMVVMRADGRPPEPHPPGEDPWSLTVMTPRMAGADVALIDVAMSHGTGGGTYHCAVRRERGRQAGWTASCRLGRVWVS